MWAEEYQVEYLRRYLDIAVQRPFVAGMQMWNFTDFKTGQGTSRAGGMNFKGVFTRDRRPRMAAHFLRSRWASGSRGKGAAERRGDRPGWSRGVQRRPASLWSHAGGSASLGGLRAVPAVAGGTGRADRSRSFVPRGSGQRPVLSGNRVALLRAGLQAFTAVFDAIEAARDHVNLEFYILQDVSMPGADGPSLFALLREKLRQGVAVTIIYDSLGSAATPTADLDTLRVAGATLLSFNPASPLEARGAWRPNERDHRKILE